MSRYDQINTLTDLMCLEAGIVHYTAILDPEDHDSLDRILQSFPPEEARNLKRNFRKQLRKSVKDSTKRADMPPAVRRRSVMTRIRNRAWNSVIKLERDIEDNL